MLNVYLFRLGIRGEELRVGVSKLDLVSYLAKTFK